MTNDEKALWISSRELARLLREFRDNDVKVNVLGTLVPVAGATYDPSADVVSIELAAGLELRMLQDADDAWRASQPKEPLSRMSSQRIEHPLHCPECGAQVCLTREHGVWVAHCAREHEEETDCEWTMLLPVDTSVTGGITFVGVNDCESDPMP